MKPKILCLLALLACLTGCVPVDSLNPLYTANNVIFDPALLGKWVGGNPDEGFLRFDRAAQDSYQMVMVSRNSEAVEEQIYIAHLVNLGGEKFLDVSPKELEPSAEQYLFRTDPVRKGSRFEPKLERIGTGFYVEVLGPTPGRGNSQELQLKVRPVHWIFKVSLSEKTLTLSYLDREWVQEAIKKKLIQAEHVKAKEGNDTGWVLSGSTAELQQFIVHHADDPEAFNSGSALSKVE
jgi:hypothetical protein